jgi:hypothetical protein
MEDNGTILNLNFLRMRYEALVHEVLFAMLFGEYSKGWHSISLKNYFEN